MEIKGAAGAPTPRACPPLPVCLHALPLIAAAPWGTGTVERSGGLNVRCPTKDSPSHRTRGVMPGVSPAPASGVAVDGVEEVPPPRERPTPARH